MKTILHVFFKLTIICFTVGYDDLSLKKPTSQSQGYDARYAVDGNQSTCMNTVDGFPVTWYVDLQEVKSIAKIWIFYNTSDHQRRYVNNYLVYLSNTTRWRDGFLCISESGPSLALPGTVKLCQTFARYVIFHNTKDSGSMFKFSLVCEVKVEGCNKKGVYGSYCDRQCPENCYGSRCYLEGGDCYSCNDGWTGNKCQTICPSGFYGKDCSHNCSRRCYRTCDPMNGSCRICAEEYIEEKCDQLRIKQPSDTDTVPLAVIVGAPTSVLVLVAIFVTVICFRRRFLKCCEKSQTPGNDVAVTVSGIEDDSHLYETLNFSRKHM